MKKSKTKHLSDTGGGSHKGNHCSTSQTQRQSGTISGAFLAADIGSFVGQNRKNDANMNDLKQLAEITQSRADRNKSGAALPVSVPRVTEANSTPAPRVPEGNSTRLPPTAQTRLMRVIRQQNNSTPNVPEPRVPSARTLRAIERQRRAQTDTTTPSTQAIRAALELHEPRVPSKEVRRAAKEGIKILKKKVAATNDPAPIARRTRSHNIKPAEPVASRTRSQLALEIITESANSVARSHSAQALDVALAAT